MLSISQNQDYMICVAVADQNCSKADTQLMAAADPSAQPGKTMASSPTAFFNPTLLNHLPSNPILDHKWDHLPS